MQDLAGGYWQQTRVDLVIDLVQHVGNRRCQPGGSSQPHAAGEHCDQRHRAEDETALSNVTSRYSLYWPSGLIQSLPSSRRVGVDQFGATAPSPDNEGDEDDL
jgi:hypothetical protein